LREKISLFCSVPQEAVIEAKDVDSIYQLPLVFKEQCLDRLILKHFGIKPPAHSTLKDWERKVVEKAISPRHKTKIAVVGKYIGLQDAYKSIYEALAHAGIANDSRVEVEKIDSEDIEKEGAERFLRQVSGVLVPGGFGSRGIEGKIKSIEYARTNRIPFLGICLGMQCAVIEFARNVCGLKNANSTEFAPVTAYPVISLLKEQENVSDMGGTMRLGAYPCGISPETRAFSCYRKKLIEERHRHRYEFNNEYRRLLEKNGLVFSGIYPRKHLAEIVELPGHPFFMAVQFHPEFKSKPDKAHPLFRDFIKCALKIKR
jgi:CTP synthase